MMEKQQASGKWGVKRVLHKLRGKSAKVGDILFKVIICKILVIYFLFPELRPTKIYPLWCFYFSWLVAFSLLSLATSPLVHFLVFLKVLLHHFWKMRDHQVKLFLFLQNSHKMPSIKQCSQKIIPLSRSLEEKDINHHGKNGRHPQDAGTTLLFSLCDSSHLH